MNKCIKFFFAFGIVYMFIGVLIGGAISGGPLAEYIDTDEGHWLEAIHAFVDFIGFFTLIIFGLLLYVVPKISNKKIYSEKVSWWSFWIINIGLVLMAVFMTLKGLSGVDYGIVIMVGGIILTIGYLLFGYNILKSL